MTEQEKIDRMFRDAFKVLTKKMEGLPHNLQNVHTPFDLCNEMIERAERYAPLHGQTHLTFNIEFLDVLLYNYKIEAERIWFITDCPQKKIIVQQYERFKGVNVILVNNILNWETNMKFDRIWGNPPYQAPRIKRMDSDKNYTGRNSVLWDKFVIKSLSILKDKGFLCFIHPSKWRRVDSELWEIMKNKQIHYLEIHDFDDGVKTFGCQTRYDWYILQNEKVFCPTKVIDQFGIESSIDLRESIFIPNGMLKETIPLLAKRDGKRIKILYSCAYHHQHENMRKIKDCQYKYPCVWSIDRNGNVNLWYSNTNEEGHFGIPKVIFPSGHYGSVDVLVDKEGEYGMTEFAKGIVDLPENLENIAKAMRTEKFKKIAMCISTATTELDRHALSLFKRDFWKEFVDKNGNKIA